MNQAENVFSTPSRCPIRRSGLHQNINWKGRGECDSACGTCHGEGDTGILPTHRTQGEEIHVRGRHLPVGRGSGLVAVPAHCDVL